MIRYGAPKKFSNIEVVRNGGKKYANVLFNYLVIIVRGNYCINQIVVFNQF